MILIGTVQEIGTSAGKTLAAWNGIPCGERYLLVATDTTGIRDMVMVWYPEHSELLDGFLGKQINVEGAWFVREDEIDYANSQHPIKSVEIPSSMLAGIDLEEWLDGPMQEPPNINWAATPEKTIRADVPIHPRKIVIATQISIL